MTVPDVLDTLWLVSGVVPREPRPLDASVARVRRRRSRGELTARQYRLALERRGSLAVRLARHTDRDERLRGCR